MKVLQPDLEAMVREAIREHPVVVSLVEEIRRTLPDQIVEQAVTFDSAVLNAVIEELAKSVEAVDVQAIARQVLSNEGLKGRIAVQIDDLGVGLSERIRGAIQETIRSETEQIRNLLTARRARDKAVQVQLMQRRDQLEVQRQVAIAKGELLWLQWSRPLVLVPLLLLAVLLGWGIRGVRFNDPGPGEDRREELRSQIQSANRATGAFAEKSMG